MNRTAARDKKRSTDKSPIKILRTYVTSLITQ